MILSFISVLKSAISLNYLQIIQIGDHCEHIFACSNFEKLISGDGTREDATSRQ
jgi:hypothetical protein